MIQMWLCPMRILFSMEDKLKRWSAIGLEDGGGFKNCVYVAEVVDEIF